MFHREADDQAHEPNEERRSTPAHGYKHPTLERYLVCRLRREGREKYEGGLKPLRREKELSTLRAAGCHTKFCVMVNSGKAHKPGLAWV